MTAPRGLAGFVSRRDERVADEVQEDRALMCAAQNCPNRWSIDAGSGRVCTAHAASERHRWPQVTEEQLAAVVARARAAAEPARRATPLTIDQKRALLRRLGTFGGTKPGRAWAKALQAREEAGADLTRTQRDMWRAALGTRRERMPDAPAERLEIPEPDPLPIEAMARELDDVPPAWVDEDIPYDDEVSA